MNRKGQVFVMSAVIFSSIVLLAITSTQQNYTTTSDADARMFFDSLVDRHPEVVDAGLRNNFSIESVKKEFYTFNRFVERRSEGKSLTYEAFQLVMLPSKGKALAINYRDDTVSFGIHDGTWNNRTLDPSQNAVLNINTGTDYWFRSEDIKMDERFNASKPTVMAQIRVESGEAVLADDILR